MLMVAALGCPDVEKPRYGWLIRERPDIAVLGCNESSVVWRLTCDDNRWTGPTVNCSPPGTTQTILLVINLTLQVTTVTLHHSGRHLQSSKPLRPIAVICSPREPGQSSADEASA